MFHQRENKCEYEYLDVVDGQQRLATIILFLDTIIKILLSKKSDKVSQKTYARYVYDNYSYKLEMENEDSGFLHETILAETLPKLSKFETTAQRKLKLSCFFLSLVKS